MTYAGTGVDYGVMDPFKRAAIRAAGNTDANAKGLGYRAVEWSRGESCFFLEGIEPEHIEFGGSTLGVR